MSFSRITLIWLGFSCIGTIIVRVCVLMVAFFCQETDIVERWEVPDANTGYECDLEWACAADVRLRHIQLLSWDNILQGRE